MAVSRWVQKRDRRNKAGEVTGHAWRAGYRDDGGKIHTKQFTRKVDANNWLDDQLADLVRGEHIAPDVAKTTMRAWSDQWLEGYATRRPSTVRQARVHLGHINATFGDVPLRAIRPSAINAWTAGLQAQGLADSTVHAIYRRLAQLLGDAAADGLIPRSPISRKTTVKVGQRDIYLPTTAEVWALHDAFPEHLRPAVLLGAFAGLRVAEVCGLRVTDVNFLRREVTPAVQYPAEVLKTDASRATIPLPGTVVEELSAHLAAFPGPWVLSDHLGEQVGPWTVERAHRAARKTATTPTGDPLGDGFRFHDLRHFYASALIAGGHDIKTVQARLRHENATTTLRTYSHLWPGQDDRTRDTLEQLIVGRKVAER